MNLKETLKRYQDKHSIKLKRDDRTGLTTVKYARSVFYEDAWDDFLEECRGMVIDDDYNIVSLPFRKIYNFGIEKRAPKFERDESVMFMRKVQDQCHQ